MKENKKMRFCEISSGIIRLSLVIFNRLFGCTVSYRKMEDYVKSELNTKMFKRVRSNAGGCVSSADVYETDEGNIFIKCNSGSKAKSMFEGEFESLKELSKAKAIKVPKPVLVGNVGKQYFIVLEFLEMRSLLKYSSRLGCLLAGMHLCNIKRLRGKDKSQFVHCKDVPIDKFGFHVSTSCGYLPQANQWCDDWVQFYTTQRLQQQVNLILEKNGNREINELWTQLQIKIPTFFKDVKIEPSLLHGDLWIGNAGESNDEPIIFDPASFYGHHEYDLAIATMFHGFDKNFFESYHSIIPKAAGFEQRHQLYLLFHHLNHWNHFGSHKDSSLKLMRNLLLK